MPAPLLPLMPVFWCLTCCKARAGCVHMNERLLARHVPPSFSHSLSLQFLSLPNSLLLPFHSPFLPVGSSAAGSLAVLSDSRKGGRERSWREREGLTTRLARSYPYQQLPDALLGHATHFCGLLKDKAYKHPPDAHFLPAVFLLAPASGAEWVKLHMRLPSVFPQLPLTWPSREQ